MHGSATGTMAVKSSEVSVEQGRTRRNALACALLVGLCVLLTHPVLEMGINDDPSYIRTALDFARTGRFVYHGWSNAMLGSQIVWGALFIKLFGFSFTAVRLSTLPLGMASAYLLHQTLVRFGINSWNAIIGTLTLCLSPLFLVLTPTFMTDIPGLFFILLCLYMCQRAVLASTHKAALWWLCSATLVNVVGGTARQIVWVGALVLVPCTAWLLRRRRGSLMTGALLWLASVVAIFAIMHWFYQQPYSLPEKMPPGPIFSIPLARKLLVSIVQTLLSLLLFALPVFAGFLITIRRVPAKVVALYSVLAATCIATLPLLARHTPSPYTYFLPPSMGNLVNASGMSYVWDTIGSKPDALSIPVRIVLFLVVIAAGVAFFAFVSSRPARTDVHDPQTSSLSWHQLLVLVVPLALGYIALCVPRTIYRLLVDRYLLAVLAVIIILLLRFFQERVQPRLPAISVVLLALFTIWGVAATHDLFAMDRARLAATQEMEHAGVPRTMIEGGYEYDIWTQLEVVGHANEPSVQVPSGIYHPTRYRDTWPPYRFWYADRTAALDPKYVLVFSPQTFLVPSPFAPVPYRTWLPPFGAVIYVQQIP